MPKITLYLKAGIAEDSQILSIWEAASVSGRPQDLFRRLLMLGIRAAHDRGELTHAAEEVLDRDVVKPLSPKLSATSPKPYAIPTGAPGVPAGWSVGDPPLVQHRNKPRGRSSPLHRPGVEGVKHAKVETPVLQPAAAVPLHDSSTDATPQVDVHLPPLPKVDSRHLVQDGEDKENMSITGLPISDSTVDVGKPGAKLGNLMGW